jgi:hypothetical protein
LICAPPAAIYSNKEAKPAVRYKLMDLFHSWRQHLNCSHQKQTESSAVLAKFSMLLVLISCSVEKSRKPALIFLPNFSFRLLVENNGLSKNSSDYSLFFFYTKITKANKICNFCKISIDNGNFLFYT